MDLDDLIKLFVQLHAGMKQRDSSWYTAIGTTVGGSELAAIMGINPYSSFLDVVDTKISILDGGNGNWNGGNEACWWGVLFEDIIGVYTEINLGSPLHGDEICVQAIAGHRNSPDGYIVGKFYLENDEFHLWTTDMDPLIETFQMIVLLEFKCPLTRKPNGSIPKHYVPQVLSGLAVSPIAIRGLFVDSVFRKCCLLDLGDNPNYDTTYHFRDDASDRDPVAWGIILVYAPKLDTPRHVRFGWRGPVWVQGDPSSDEPDNDAAYAAWDIRSRYLGMRDSTELVDFGDMDKNLFNRSLGLINRNKFIIRRELPYFADGRGNNMPLDKAIATIPPSEHYSLLGVIPWKLFEVNYVQVDRRSEFLEKLMPLIESVHQTVAEARSSGDTTAYMYKKRTQIAATRNEKKINEKNLQDLFDSVII